jgi:DNA (cytosine-5)-methyltransferase 1
MKAISLFASGGIGDLALKKAGVDIVLTNELLPERVSVYSRNFPESIALAGDIWELKEEIINKTLELTQGETLDILLATPPCQGMSKNGQGILLKNIREGKRPQIDVRNRLVIPTVEIIKRLKPNLVIFENVPEMQNTVINDEDGNYINILEYIRRELSSEYVGKAEVVEFADYGVPQRRKRLITVYSKKNAFKEHLEKCGTFIPKKTHSSQPKLGEKPWVTVRDTISSLPTLDGKDKVSASSGIPYHHVPVLDPKKYNWISRTPDEKGAFDNQCSNPTCLYQGNATHGSTRNGDGINRANQTTPLYCEKCGSLLPRPYTIKDGKLQIMAGFTSAYKRMRWDLPSPTLTTNLCYPSSDHKVHPSQNRVLSLFEAFKLHSLDKFDYIWEHKDGKPAANTLIRDIIGESIPPMGLYAIIEHLLSIYREE